MYTQPPTPDAPEPAPKNRRRWPVFLVVFVVGVVVAAGVGVGFVVTSGGSGFPSAWDPQVAPIAARVAALRGLQFKHPVNVNYLSAQAFEKKLTASPADLKKHAKEIQQATGLLRAAGLVGPNVNLADAVNATQAADTAAFYDDHTKQIYLRAGAFTVETRVDLAHELTHVLQDQYFDLPKLEKRAAASTSGSSDALTALIEGDATRIQDKYLGAQSAADRRAYDRFSTRSSKQADQRTRHLPAVVGTYFGAPYIFGPQAIAILETGGGNAAINAALTGPTPSTRIYFDPTAVEDSPTRPPIPALKAGEQKLTLSSSSNDSGFDNFTLYLMLAARLDRPTALLAADAYSGGSEADYTRAGTTCFRAAIVGVNAPSTRFLASTLRRWTQAMPDAAIESTSGPVVFHSCDPGAHARTPDDAAINQATALIATRGEIVASAVGPRVPAKLATCVARVLVEQPDFRDAILGNSNTLNKPTQQMLKESVTAGIACHNNPIAGLPGATP